MIRASLYGRLGQDPQSLTTKSGKAMARASIAVDCTAHNAEQQETDATVRPTGGKPAAKASVAPAALAASSIPGMDEDGIPF
jgi:hypothetical protein